MWWIAVLIASSIVLITSLPARAIFTPDGIYSPYTASDIDEPVLRAEIPVSDPAPTNIHGFRVTDTTLDNMFPAFEAPPHRDVMIDLQLMTGWQPIVNQKLKTTHPRLGRLGVISNAGLRLASQGLQIAWTVVNWRLKR